MISDAQLEEMRRIIRAADRRHELLRTVEQDRKKAKKK